MIILSGAKPTLSRLPTVPMPIGIDKLKKFFKQEKPNQETGDKSLVPKDNMPVRLEPDLDQSMMLILAL